MEADFSSLERGNRLDCLGIDTGATSLLSPEIFHRGGSCESIGLWNGYDMSTKTGLNWILLTVRSKRPRVVVMKTPVCYGCRWVLLPHTTKRGHCRI